MTATGNLSIMKVLLLGNYTLDQQYSMLGFAQTMLSGLAARGIDVRMIAPQPLLGKLPVKKAAITKWLGYGDKYLLFPSRLRRAMSWADVIHICDHSNAMYVRHIKHRPHVVTCHDLLAILSAQGRITEWATKASGQAYQRMILEGINQANFVACDSEATRRDLLSTSSLPPEKAAVIYIGFVRPVSAMPEAESAILLEALGISRGEPFLLHVGGNQAYKNRLGLLKIYAALNRMSGWNPMRLVMAGKPFTAELRRYIEAEQLGELVLERSGLSDESIRALYSCATALIFPSIYEGFGLPIIEAQACGCPVFTSNRAPMTEVGGDAAIYFDPMDPVSAAQVIKNRLAATSDLVAAGKANIERFTSERMIDDYINLYHQILGKSQ
jgi:glycosyltransferase involved in cell wall biosynthesis